MASGLAEHSSRRTRVRWIIVGLAFAGTSINYIDRANLGVAMPYLSKELHLNPVQVGLVLSGFFWTYAAFQLISGPLVDRYGPRLMYAIASTWWSVLTALTAVARGFGSLLGFRLLLGSGEAAAYPSNAKAVGEWFPTRERGLATAIYDSGARVGTALSVPIVAAVIAAFGWRSSFVATGLLGLVWTVAWVAIYRSPRKHRWASSAEVEYIESGQQAHGTAAASRVAWKDLLGHRAVWAMMIGNFCIAFVIYWFVTWFPSYLVQSRGFTLASLGAFGSVPAIVAIPTGWLGGWVADRLVQRGVAVSLARKACIVGGMLVSTVIVLSLFTHSSAVALTLMSIAYGSLTFANASVWSLPADLAPTQGHVASLAGLMNFAGNVAGIAISTFVGAALQLTHGSYVLPLVVAGAFAVVGAVNYLFLMGPVRPIGAQRGSKPAVPTTSSV